MGRDPDWVGFSAMFCYLGRRDFGRTYVRPRERDRRERYWYHSSEPAAASYWIDNGGWNHRVWDLAEIVSIDSVRSELDSVVAEGFSGFDWAVWSLRRRRRTIYWWSARAVERKLDGRTETGHRVDCDAPNGGDDHWADGITSDTRWKVALDRPYRSERTSLVSSMGVWKRKRLRTVTWRNPSAVPYSNERIIWRCANIKRTSDKRREQEEPDYLRSAESFLSPPTNGNRSADGRIEVAHVCASRAWTVSWSRLQYWKRNHQGTVNT